MRQRLAPGKLVAFGLGLAAIAATVGVVIWQVRLRDGIAQAPVLTCAGICAFGILVGIVGLFMPGDDGRSITMTQTAGDRSTQQQAGRDIVGRPEGEQQRRPDA